MADPEDLSLAGDVDSDNGDTINDAPEEAGVGVGRGAVGSLDSDDDEPDHHPAPVAIGNGSVTNRYREIMQQQHQDGSDVSSLENSSFHGLPKRAGSPIDSVLSGPDDTPSIQVGILLSLLGQAYLTCIGFLYLFTWQQHSTICSLAPRLE